MEIIVLRVNKYAVALPRLETANEIAQITLSWRDIRPVMTTVAEGCLETGR
jgi:hypothetical protein